jgi:hypothetical protein
VQRGLITDVKENQKRHSKISEVAIELCVCRIDVSLRIQEYFAHVEVTIGCRAVQRGLQTSAPGNTADAAENQQHIFKQADADIVPGSLCIDVSFRIQQHFANVGKPFDSGDV